MELTPMSSFSLSYEVPLIIKDDMWTSFDGQVYWKLSTPDHTWTFRASHHTWSIGTNYVAIRLLIARSETRRKMRQNARRKRR